MCRDLRTTQTPKAQTAHASRLETPTSVTHSYRRRGGGSARGYAFLGFMNGSGAFFSGRAFSRGPPTTGSLLSWAFCHFSSILSLLSSSSSSSSSSPTISAFLFRSFDEAAAPLARPLLLLGSAVFLTSSAVRIFLWRVSLTPPLLSVDVSAASRLLAPE